MRLASAVMLAVVSLLAMPAEATVLCYTGDGSGAVGELTASASAKLLEAASQAMLAFRGLRESGAAFGEHKRRATDLLESAVADYRRAQSMAEELGRLDTFLRARPFEQLRLVFGITPGSLNATRWEAFAAMARRSKAPAAEIIGVCVNGAESLKAGLAAIGADTSPAQLRRALNAWFLVISHGGLASDAFDPTIR
jgi:hypothetical protein